MTTSKDLPAIVGAFGDIEKYVQQGEFKALLNQNPNKAWVKDHPFASNVKYLPIDKVETMLDMIFQQWRVEVLSITQLAQSICCTVRLHYYNPVSESWSFHDGVGAVPLKTDKGYSAADLSHIKSDAVATGAPAAKSFAIKDAAEHLGKLFGRDINRKDVVAYTNLFQEPDKASWKKMLGAAANMDDLRKIWNKIPAEMQEDEELKKLKDAMKVALKEDDNES